MSNDMYPLVLSKPETCPVNTTSEERGALAM